MRDSMARSRPVALRLLWLPVGGVLAVGLLGGCGADHADVEGAWVGNVACQSTSGAAFGYTFTANVSQSDADASGSLTLRSTASGGAQTGPAGMTGKVDGTKFSLWSDDTSLGIILSGTVSGSIWSGSLTHSGLAANQSCTFTAGLNGATP